MNLSGNSTSLKSDMQSSPTNVSELARYFSSSRDANEKVSLIWQDITFETFVKDDTTSKFIAPSYRNKTILNQISGKAESGELMAILGPTGSGKTSLLNVLAARTPVADSAMTRLTGSIWVNGMPRNEKKFREMSAYVIQVKLYINLALLFLFMLMRITYLPG